MVEDEKDIADLVSLHLKRQGYQVASVADGETAVAKLGAEPIDLVVLDWMLPNMSGLEVAKAMRSRTDGIGNTPILMLTARSHSADIVQGLESGADDFLVKPFELPVLMARVKALLRRGALINGESSSVLQVDELELNLGSYEVRCSGKPVQLTLSEFRLLSALMRGRGSVLTRDRLIDQVQGDDVNVIERTIDTHVFGLRKKLGKCSDVIETIRGVGYRVRVE
ncbi:MAG: response regulator transcription factor [Deltaproteobacteria bacterium]|nr:response regulator transcription factor [Deltaproteobacteria bacterium]MBI3293883.1 response regulator transcription factor [Deltaproteobacteria bacterium]